MTDKDYSLKQPFQEIRNHPEFIKLLDELGRSVKDLRFANAMGRILEKRIELLEEEVALLSNR